jgi:uncharacterized surface protein with fasciclin (FAS1) repeats
MNKLFLYFELIFCIGIFASCKEEYFYENNIPSELGKSIYDELQSGKHGSFTDYIRLIDDLGYTEVLAKTGSKTLFVADDEAFGRFYESNAWNVRRYEDFSLAQKKLIMNSSIINNALLIENLSTIEGDVDGQVLRRNTALSVLDTITFEVGDNIPDNIYWERFHTKGVYLAKDNTAIPLLHFLDAQMRAHHITGEDFATLFNGVQYNRPDAYIYNVKVIERDIVCQNGYIHILEEVLIPPSNMAETLRTLPETQLFSSFLERFAAPYYSAPLTEQFRLLGGADSVFIKRYFAQRNSASPGAPSSTVIDPNGRPVANFLLFDPGWNSYVASGTGGSYQTNMAALFAPSNDALYKFFHEGAGRSLLDRYGSMEQIPNEVLDKLIKNHMKPDFLASIPSQFHTITDDAQERMGVERAHVEKVYLASNGAIYVTNTVYSPALYSSVMFPATINENMKVINWAIDQLDFDPYLLSMVNYYSFLIPTDNFTYIVPTALKHPEPEAWKFRFNYQQNRVYASVHPYDIETFEIGDSVNVVTDAGTLGDHLEDILDYHIIVGDIEDGKEYYRTKGYGTIRVTRDGNRIQLAGGGDIDRNTSVMVDEIYDQTKETNGRGNGKAYAIDEPVQTPLRSVYEILSTTDEFSEFFALLQGFDDLWTGDRAIKYNIFYKDASQAGMDMNVRFLNTFHYTLYVPTNDKVLDAINRRVLPTWDEVEAATDQDERDAKAEKIIRFLRYHFQDNAVFLDKPAIAASYETATLDNATETFYKLALSGGNYSLHIRTEAGGQASVKTADGLFNIMARDFKFNNATPAAATRIETSSYIVIHQIDECLYFE